MWKFPVPSWPCHLYIIAEFRDAIISAPIMTVYPLLNSIRAVHRRWIAPGRRFTLVPTTASLALQACLKEMSKMNRAIWRCWKVDGFLFDWPSFPHSSSRRHLLMIPVVPVCHHVSTLSHPETRVGKWGKDRKARRREASILWYRKRLSVEHGYGWSNNCTAQRNSEPCLR